MTIKGIGASQGVAIAKVFKIEEIKLSYEKSTTDPQLSLKKYNDAKNAVIKKITKSKELAKDPEHVGIFEAHLNFVTDEYAVSSINDLIQNQKYSAEYAIESFYKEFANMLAGLDEYMRERVADVYDVSKKLIQSILGIQESDLTQIHEEVIIVAEDLSPSQTVQLDKKFVKGFVTNIGGTTSHTAIMARSLGIPSVVGTNVIMDKAYSGDILALNGSDGIVIVNPTQEEIEHFKQEEEKYKLYLERLTKLKGQPSVTVDGHHIEIAANIGTPKDLDSVLSNDAEGVGLFRSEFLYMDNDNWPSEEEQFQAYKTVVEGMKGKRVVIRTLDIGGDKTLKYFKFPSELNPFLGYRAIRFCLQNPEIFKTQLRALIRASEFGNVAIMFPMITNVKEFLDAKEMYLQAYEEVYANNKNIAPKDKIQVGLMMETPAAAVLSDQFCKYADFVSIGTNDLIQYSMAADRMNENISYLYQPLSPSILRLIKMIIDGAHKHGKWAGMCGEMAGDPKALPLLLGLGLDEFSMSASSVLKSRELARNLSYQEMKQLANKALELDTESKVIELLEQTLNK
ncbi:MULTISPECIES: phosphoenolpyruvate--protein phosphotransferase [unclassified Mycoplasma]|uniref:phosphoenolpyruvate--protein phosphotransferase n=1 Tax=unclassified Mycoplasma TaxID=2683645 RepID=UPI00211C823B|nr:MULTISPECIES: phosphoenolpyruvate--protein phosphotransferase [unclassified Mycoplasma]UUM19948.1 phosphoenolpyruvate--protein phosphotransferase [Mycoplasma sp. 1578d]UUM24929.1 phosphoenolpyruvate--protein phosphotransferase [Mycoplasma sp. 3686d]